MDGAVEVLRCAWCGSEFRSKEAEIMQDGSPNFKLLRLGRRIHLLRMIEEVVDGAESDCPYL